MTEFPHDFPRCWPWSRLIGKLLLRLLGWTPHGSLPNTGKAVLIAFPHTSNWDYFFAVLTGWTFGVSFQWLGKDALFRFPLGVVTRFMGGVAVVRSAPQGLVGQITERFRRADRLFLMVPVEGTRRYQPYWKSGFYFIAREAGVPIILGFLDFGRKRSGFGPSLIPSGDVSSDMDRIRAFYADIEGQHPQQKSRIRLKIEDETP